MKSKILALSKNEEFKQLLQKKKVSNKYVTIFFGQINNRNNKKINISFVVKKKLGNAV
jgi:ribonuclease P protein component